MTGLVFSGHRVDDPGRIPPRFPAALAEAAAAAIGRRIGDASEGIASAANGGDILFLEVCAARGIATTIVIAIDPAAFAARSVATTAPGNWEARFWQLWESHPPTRRRVMDVPARTNPFDATNAALIEVAVAGPARTLVLWDGSENNRPGGTDDFVRLARAQNLAVDIVDPAALAPDA